MERTQSLFDLFGGIRPMARAIGEAPSTVASWKRGGRIPAEKQPVVLKIGQGIGLGISADHVVFPLGCPATDASDLAHPAKAVCFNHADETKREGQA
ncbi:MULTISPECIES: carph-isopro domain-containing protein [unclassified Sphingobium]|uniref:carph-isopro domain-containing protein n=1 Tax=unclassified Sphingobium TaxID=2611147 RepID=UPI00222446F1|nr:MULTISPECIES: hypothetical protein [unclassified Sphingobium]MCW2396186.1 hypothetical protein [Sphingobium sp. B8D3B]MCW2419702.1 hypothetical protein [Sphingobium sp. B8D3C]